MGIGGRATRHTTPMSMVLVVVVAAAVVVVVATAAEEAQEGGSKYTTKYDGIDIEAVIRNERLLNGYVGCLLERGACTPDAAELKKNLPDALAHDCSSCSQAQKSIADRLAHHLIDRRPEDWARLEELYDPSGDYRERYLHPEGEQEEEGEDGDDGDETAENKNQSA